MMNLKQRFQEFLSSNYVGIDNAVEGSSLSQFLTICGRRLSEVLDSSLRDYTPVLESSVVFNGVKVESESSYRLLDTLTTASSGRKKYYEGAIIDGLEKVAEEGDRVLIVGGGWGVSTVRASQSVGKDGEVITYEGSEKKVRDIERTLNLNETPSELVIRENTVSENYGVWGEETSRETVEPTHLPECDILVLDCEGAEEDIIKGLEQRPRAVIVEVHPEYGVRYEDISTYLVQEGYREVDHRFHSGEKIYSDISKYPENPTTIAFFEREDK